MFAQGFKPFLFPRNGSDLCAQVLGTRDPADRYKISRGTNHDRAYGFREEGRDVMRFGVLGVRWCRDEDVRVGEAERRGWVRDYQRP
jgi:hypothetical protein